MSEFVVKPRRFRFPWVCAVVALLAAAALLACLLSNGGYWYNTAVRLGANGAGAAGAVAPLPRDLTALQGKTARLEQAALLDEKAMAQLQRDLRAAQEKNFRLREELAFYQGVMDTAIAGKGLGVHGIRLAPLSRERAWRLELVLVNLAEPKETTEGVLDLTVEGVQDAVTKYLDVSEISIDGNAAHDFRFNNFQRFESNFVLPDDFEPLRIWVKLLLKDAKGARVEKMFDWLPTVGEEDADVG